MDQPTQKLHLSRSLLGANAAAPRRLRALLELTVELDVDPLVEEAKVVLDAAYLRERITVVPDQIRLAVHRVVGSRPLVRTARHGVARLELGEHIVARDVPARRKA